MVDALMNWLLDGADAALRSWPDWTPTLPDISGLTTPLAEINWMVAIDVPWTIAAAMLALGPAMLLVTLTLWAIGLLTPTSTTR